MRFACLIIKSTNTHSEHIIITAFQRQELLHERASGLRYAYIACLVPLKMTKIWLRLLVSRDTLPGPRSSSSWEGYIVHTFTEKLH